VTAPVGERARVRESLAKHDTAPRGLEPSLPIENAFKPYCVAPTFIYWCGQKKVHGRLACGL